MVPDARGGEDISQDFTIDIDQDGIEAPSRRCGSCGTFCGRDYTDWSQIILGVGGGASGGSVLVGYLINDPYVVAGSVAAFALTLFFGCCRIGCLKPVKNIEGQLDDLNVRIQELENENSKLQKNISKLEGIRDDLKAANEEAKKTIGELRVMLQEKIAALKAVAEKLGETEKKLKVLEELFTQYQQETRKIAKEINRFNMSQEEFKNQAGEFSGEVKKLKIAKGELFKKIEDFNDADQYRKEQIEQLAKIREGLQGDIFFFKEQFTALNEELKEFRTHVQKIDLEEDKFGESVGKMDKVSKELMETAAELAKELADLSGDDSETAGTV
jgi:chromosome segregation ATPase